MNHARTSIRQAFVTALKDKTAAGSNVFDARIYSINQSSLPAIIVFSNHEEIITSTMGARRSCDRMVKIIIECYVKATSDVNLIVDNLVMEIEELIFTDTELRQFYKDCKLESMDMTLNNDGDQSVAVASLIFNVNYRTREGIPEITI